MLPLSCLASKPGAAPAAGDGKGKGKGKGKGGEGKGKGKSKDRSRGWRVDPEMGRPGVKIDLGRPNVMNRSVVSP